MCKKASEGWTDWDETLQEPLSPEEMAERADAGGCFMQGPGPVKLNGRLLHGNSFKNPGDYHLVAYQILNLKLLGFGSTSMVYRISSNRTPQGSIFRSVRRTATIRGAKI